MSNIKSIIRVFINPTIATAIPPMGPILSQNGVNAIDFCKIINEASIIYNKDLTFPIIIFLYRNLSYTFIIKLPNISFLYKKLLNIEKNIKEVALKKKKTNIINFIRNKNLLYYNAVVSQQQLFILMFLKAIQFDIFKHPKKYLYMFIGSAHSAGIFIKQKK